MSVSEQLSRKIRTIPDFPKPGISFKDLTPVLGDPRLCDALADVLVEPFREQGVEVIAAIESRGFILGTLMAQKLGCGLVLVRKRGKLPAATISEEYELEYGAAVIEMHRDSFPLGSRVLIHDDLLATGGTASASAKLCEKLGAELMGFSFIIELATLQGREALQPYSSNIVSIVKF